jgi:hypothetical protein
MPVVINKTKVRLDFDIFAILEFDLLIDYPLDKLFKENPSHGSIDDKFGKAASSIHIFHLEILMAKHEPNQIRLRR